MKRLFAIVLCLAMLLSYAVPSVYATENTTGSTDDIYFADGSTINNFNTDTKEETSSPVVDNGSDEEKLPVCDCDMDADLAYHADSCTLKRYYMGISNQDASKLYAKWEEFPEDVRSFILQYLSENDQEKLAYLQSMLNTDLSGKDSAQMDGAVINVSNIPAGGSLTVVPVMQTRSGGTSAAAAAVEAALAEREDDTPTNQLFMWDISVQDPNGNEWQPYAKPVTVEVTIPGVELHPYTQVFVIHVGDDGETNTIAATVTEDGGISFETTSFSTFAGFTVDFEYDNVKFSINGLTSILLSELFEELRMPLYVSDVANVEFTDTSLVTVTKQEGGDWLLTSLKAFDTTEALTLTMNDGTVYTIKVTDAVKVKVSSAGAETSYSSGSTIYWYADGNGDLQNYIDDGTYDNPHWSQTNTIYFSGSGTLTIEIRPAAGASTNYWINLHQIKVSDGVKLRIVLSDQFYSNANKQTECVIRAASTATMFLIEEGSLVLRGLEDDDTKAYSTKLVLDGNGTGNTINPIVHMQSTSGDDSSLVATDLIFRDARNGAIRCRSNEMKEVTIKRCSFENTVNRKGYVNDGKYNEGGNGGAIYIAEATPVESGKTLGYVVDVHKLTIEDCSFAGNEATGTGGAIALYGRVHVSSIKNCSFSNCKTMVRTYTYTSGDLKGQTVTDAGTHGGAISFSGIAGKLTVEGCSFTNCTAVEHGGAIYTVSREQKDSNPNPRYSRINSLTVSGCTFSKCKALDGHGGGILTKAQLHEFTVSGSTFSECTASTNGGAISIDSTSLPTTFGTDGTSNPNWVTDGFAANCSADFSLDCASHVGTSESGHRNWGTSSSPDRFSKVGIVNISGGGKTETKATVYKCSASSNAGGIEFAEHSYISTSATVSDMRVDGCTAYKEGSALFVSEAIIKLLTLKNVTFQNNSFTTDADGNYYSKGAAGTVRTIGNSTLVLDVQSCLFDNNFSYSNGGGLYWNANYDRAGIECEATVNDCTFTNNTALAYGGGLFVESKIKITKCNINNNKAQRGGGISQQVYNNDVRMMVDGDSTDLTLDPNTWIFQNEAVIGGGISIRANATIAIDDSSNYTHHVRFQLNGASVYENTATGDGGGICFITESYSDDAMKQAEVDRFTKYILIDSGNVYANTANGNGGGIYMQSSENTSLQIDGGYVSGNTATNGGGVYMNGKNATCYIYGGTIGGVKGETSTEPGKKMPNKAMIGTDGTGGNGGGIAISGGAKIIMGKKTAEDGTVTTATISYNVAERKGGAIFLKSKNDGANAVANTMEFNGGSIIYNTAGIEYEDTTKTPPTDCHGGAIFVGTAGVFTITDGTIQYNEAMYGNGGGVYGDGATIAIGKSDGTGSGMIKENTAAQGGGGISAENGASITVYSGTITENTASRGGGIHVTSGADLAVNGGYVTYNKAAGTCNQTTGYLLNTELVGTGGGIFIADGIPYAAATDTTPEVAENTTTFTLSGAKVGIYGNLADFAADDVFANGNKTKLNVPLVSEMNMTDFKEKPEGWYEDYPNGDTSYAQGLAGGNPFRYKMAVATERVEVLTYTDTANNNKVTLLANVENEYVCMTLGVAMAIADTIVLDFGLPVDIYVFGNDSTIRGDNSYIAGISLTAPALSGNFSTEKLISGTSISGTNYSIVVNSDQANYANTEDYITFQYTSMTVTDDITFWYAAYYKNGERYYYSTVTVVPATSIYYEDNAGMISYYGHTLTKNENGTTSKGEGVLNKFWTNAASATTSGKQDMDMPGKNENTSAATKDANAVIKEVDADNVYGYDSAYENMATYSMGNAKMATVNASQSVSARFNFTGTGFDIISLTDNDGSLIMVTVTGVTDTTYNKTFLVDNYYETGTLYQVPVIKVKGLTPGEYNVEIYVAYGAAFDHNEDQDATFYLDAIRIYDPAKGNVDVENVHQQDGELWPTYRELRNMVIDKGTFDALGKDSVSGIVFIDQHSGEISISDYQNYGPNNELYLAQDQAIAFQLAIDEADIVNVHIGLRAPSGATSVKIYDGSTALADATATAINTATDMYYDITALNTKTVVIYNSGSNLLSITNIKTTHAGAVTSGEEEEVVVVNEDVGSNAIASIIGRSADASIVPVAPSLAFDDEIRYNVYFTALNMDDVALEDMGLAIFDSKAADGTVDTAVELVPGATFDGEKYMVHTNGIPAKELGDAVYFKIYAKLADGSYVYSDVLGYNAVFYAQDILANSTNDNMKALVVSMLNYGTAAQQYFGYNTDALMNEVLTDEQKALGVEYSSDMITQIPAVDAQKAGAFVANGGYTKLAPNVSFEGVFAINYYFTPVYQPEGDLTFYYWNQADYEAADALTAENATGSKVMMSTDGVYSAAVTDLAAKQIDEAVYVVGVYEYEGVTYTTGVLSYSLSAYCADRIANGAEAMQNLAKATVAYGNSAKAYFEQV